MGNDKRIRVDKWLWQARFFKTRSLAAKAVYGGQVRLNSRKIYKPATNIASQDIFTFTQQNRVRVIKVLSIGVRRGPASEAQTLYEDLSPPKKQDGWSPKYEGKGRPGKKDRRLMEKLL